MVIKKKETKEVEVVDKLICDRCKKDQANDIIGLVKDFGSMTFYPGYGSSFDMSAWELDLCEDCWWATYEFVTGKRPAPSDDLIKEIGCIVEGIYLGPWT